MPRTEFREMIVKELKELQDMKMKKLAQAIQENAQAMVEVCNATQAEHYDSAKQTAFKVANLFAELETLQCMIEDKENLLTKLN